MQLKLLILPNVAFYGNCKFSLKTCKRLLTIIISACMVGDLKQINKVTSSVYKCVQPIAQLCQNERLNLLRPAPVTVPSQAYLNVPSQAPLTKLTSGRAPLITMRNRAPLNATWQAQAHLIVPKQAPLTAPRHARPTLPNEALLTVPNPAHLVGQDRHLKTCPANRF